MLDAETVATRARERLTELGEDVAGMTVPRLMTFVGDAKKQLAREQAASGIFLNTYALTAADGDCPLADALGEDEPLLEDFLALGSVYLDAADYPAKPLPDRGAMKLEAAGRSSYCVEGESLRLKGPDGDYAGAVTLRRMPCNPSFERVERQAADGRLVEIVAAMGAADLTKPKRTPSSKGETAT